MMTNNIDDCTKTADNFKPVIQKAEHSEVCEHYNNCECFKLGIAKGKQQEQKEEIEYIQWLLEHRWKGYTIEFIFINLQAKLDKLKAQ